MWALGRAIWRILTHRVTLRLVGLGLGATFVYASLDKVAHPDRFADVVHDYELLPMFLINAFALGMPWVEMTAGAALILGVWRRGAGLLLAALSLAFMVAIASAELRGLEVECGCFGVSGLSATEASWGLFARDVGLVLASALVWRKG
jgi:uncharacterized membrane protein YphA (DoxX/SURF4 family)